MEKQGLSELSGAGEGAQEMSVEKKKKDPISSCEKWVKVRIK